MLTVPGERFESERPEAAALEVRARLTVSVRKPAASAVTATLPVWSATMSAVGLATDSLVFERVAATRRASW